MILELAFEVISQFTKSGRERVEAMASAIAAIERENIAGDIVECGVWRGGNIMLARLMAPRRVCWLYDTFQGMTAPGPLDLRAGSGTPAMNSYRTKGIRGWARCSIDEVRGNLAHTGTLDDEFLRFVVGDVEQTLLDDQNVPDRIALLRLDTDWHASTKIELEVLYPRLSVGGILIVDDYGHWLGARKAVDDYFAGQNVAFAKIDYSAVMMTKGEPG